ncbi:MULTISPECIES: hypothetical protein [Bacillus]|uniref:hypothetical protein n=1 Tax=Bacillus TaxID=1386 RepID=UPI000C77E70C|nr:MULTISPECIES: hypothetical protein [Bacillus]MCP1161391.1 hypothetical protein [Bacillus infantis]PLR70485.1 hypothetical protein CYJ37_23415 [Bacillus sp. UMB0728]
MDIIRENGLIYLNFNGIEYRSAHIEGPVPVPKKELQEIQVKEIEDIPIQINTVVNGEAYDFTIQQDINSRAIVSFREEFQVNKWSGYFNLDVFFVARQEAIRNFEIPIDFSFADDSVKILYYHWVIENEFLISSVIHKAEQLLLQLEKETYRSLKQQTERYLQYLS